MKIDETIPGGKYMNSDGAGYHDAWGNPVTDDVVEVVVTEAIVEEVTNVDEVSPIVSKKKKIQE